MDIPEKERDVFRHNAEAIMRDRCQLGTPTQPDDGPEPGPSAYTWGKEIPCGFQFLSPDDVTADGVGQHVPTSDAVARLALSHTTTPDTRFRLTRRFGDTLETPLEFTVVGDARVGMFAQRVSLRRVTGGSIG